MTSRSADLPDDLLHALTLERFPRTSSYDAAWVVENQMGPNVLWLTEYLTQSLDLRPGMRVLDMGCGKALSSIFLASEFGVDVWATDLWIPASDNLQRIEEAGLQDHVFPVHAEAHKLPFADDCFQAAVSVDAYHYFGTDDLYLEYFSRFAKAAGQLGIVVPGLKQEVGAEIPLELVPHWHWDFCSFHSPNWWHSHWQKTGLVEVVSADWMPDGRDLWLRWEDIMEQMGPADKPSSADRLRADVNRFFGFIRLVGARRIASIYST